MWRSRGQQARALGDFFRVEDTHFTAIYTSDLKRAVAAAEAIRNSQGDPKPSSEPSKLLREQKFGDAEGKPKASEVDAALTLEELMEKRVYPVLRGYKEKFPNGESAKDLNERAKTAHAKFVLPHVFQAAKEGKTGIHIAIVSHGLCISAMIYELLKMNTVQGGATNSWTDCLGLLNTAWTRVVVDTIEVGSREI